MWWKKAVIVRLWQSIGQVPTQRFDRGTNYFINCTNVESSFKNGSVLHHSNPVSINTLSQIKQSTNSILLIHLMSNFWTLKDYNLIRFQTKALTVRLIQMSVTHLSALFPVNLFEFKVSANEMWWPSCHLPFPSAGKNYNMKCSVSILRGTLSSFFFSLCQKVAVCKPLSHSSESRLCFSTVCAWSGILEYWVQRRNVPVLVSASASLSWRWVANPDLWPLWQEASKSFPWNDVRNREAWRIKQEGHKYQSLLFDKRPLSFVIPLLSLCVSAILLCCCTLSNKAEMP